MSVGKRECKCWSREALTSSRNFINCIVRAKGRREKDGEREGEVFKKKKKHGRKEMKSRGRINLDDLSV